MIFLTIDFETYFNKQYSLKKMPTSIYVQDARFEAMSVAIRNRSVGETQVILGPKKVAEAFRRLKKFEDKIVLCGQNMYFDGYIAAHHFDFHPRFIVCTYSMAQALHASHMRTDLGTLAKHYGAPQQKLTMPDIEGKHLKDMDIRELARLIAYNKADVEATEFVALEMLKTYPRSELEIIDLTIKMFTEGRMQVNTGEAMKVFQDEVDIKREAVAKADTDIDTVMSQPKFADLLVERGYKCPVKWSEKQQKYIPALAKSDVAFQKMRDSDDPELAALVDARLKVKSTINETRAQAMLDRADYPVPVYLKYCGAHTMRWSGGDSFNPQNLPRDGRLRRCLTAPQGHVFVVVDAAQIEARDNGSFSGQDDLLEEFREYDLLGKGVAHSPYRKMAARIYKLPPEEIADTQRFVGKTTVLGCGYQMGAPKFQMTLEQGMMGPPMKISLEEAKQAINEYRAKNYKIVHTWGELQGHIAYLQESSKREKEFRGLIFRAGEIVMPNGLSLHYPGVGYQIGKFDSPEFYYQPYKAQYKKRIKNKLYGGLLLENIIQCRSRIMTAEHLRILAKYYKAVLAVHDEIVLCVPIAKADRALRDCLEVMSIPPKWNEKCPLKAEGEISEYYVKP